MAGLTKDDVREAVEDATKPMRTQVTALHGAYFGNGKPGIKTEVAVLKVRVLLLYGALGAVSLAVLAIIGKLIAGHLGGA